MVAALQGNSATLPALDVRRCKTLICFSPTPSSQRNHSVLFTPNPQTRFAARSLATELEADQIGTSDYAFRRIGEAVPLKPADSAFDLATPSPLSLAVADRHGALFLAHSHGFLVARTRDVIGVAKEVKEKEKGKGEGRCVEGVSVVDVAVLGDRSTLAVAVGQELRFYSVAALLDEVQEPLVSYSLDGASTIKGFKWQKCGDKSVVFLSNIISGESLSSHGPMKLYHGSPKDQPKDVMVDIDAGIQLICCHSHAKMTMTILYWVSALTKSWCTRKLGYKLVLHLKSVLLMVFLCVLLVRESLLGFML